MTTVRGRRKVRVGRVVSDKMDKTVVVAVERRVHHRLYGKAMRRVANLKVHDEENQYHLGDVVTVMETRPLSSTKRWRVVGLVSQREEVEVAPAQAIEAAVEEVVAPLASASEAAAVAHADVEEEQAPTAEVVPGAEAPDTEDAEASDGPAEAHAEVEEDQAPTAEVVPGAEAPDTGDDAEQAATVAETTVDAGEPDHEETEEEGKKR